MGKNTSLEVIERSIVLELLGDDHPARWTLAELQCEIHDVESDAIGEALELLGLGRVVEIEGDEAWATPCARHLSNLGMVCI